MEQVTMKKSYVLELSPEAMIKEDIG